MMQEVTAIGPRASIAAVLAMLAVILTGATHLQMPEADIRALVFTCPVLFNMGLILVNRSFDSSLAIAITMVPQWTFRGITIVAIRFIAMHPKQHL